ncbi:MAG TPA: hypothetical protein VGC80_07820 [Acetobacteraceae bacterium]
MQALKAAGAYFLLVSIAGWGFGPVREFWATPRYGALAAVLLEAPFMLAVSFFAARWVVRWSGAPRLAIGLIALLLLLVAELIGSVWLRGLSVTQILAAFAAPPGTVGLVLYLAFALMPVFVGAIVKPR